MFCIWYLCIFFVFCDHIWCMPLECANSIYAYISNTKCVLAATCSPERVVVSTHCVLEIIRSNTQKPKTDSQRFEQQKLFFSFSDYLCFPFSFSFSFLVFVFFFCCFAPDSKNWIKLTYVMISHHKHKKTLQNKAQNQKQAPTINLSLHP